MPIFRMKIREEFHGLVERGILVEVEHVKAHRTKKEKYVSHFESLSLKAMRRLVNWQKQRQCWTKDLWRKREQKLCSRKERRYAQPCSKQLASTA